MSGIAPNIVYGSGTNPMATVIADGANLDAFSRLRVSQPTTLFSVQCQYNVAPIVMESGNTGTGVAPAHSANDRMVKLSATAGSGTSFMQSYQYVPYQPGKSQLILITGLLGAGVAGATVDVGYFDASNGIFLRQNGASGLQIVRRTSTSGSVVDNVVNKADWNIDKMDGTGTSGITIDEETVYILVIDLQFLGMGRVRVGFNIGGVLYYCHEFLNANNLAVPYMQTATLPVQMLLTATSTAATKDCYFKCASVNSEGGASVFEDFAFAFSTPQAAITASSGARTHAVSIRPKTTFNSITNRMTFAIDSIDIIVTGSNPVLWELCVGQALTTPSYSDVNTNNSGFEYETAGTLSGNPSIVISSGYISASNQVKESISRVIGERYPITLDRSGAVRDMGTLTLLLTGIGGTSATRSIINYKEIR